MKNIVAVLILSSCLTVYGQDGNPDIAFNAAKLSYKTGGLNKAMDECNASLKIDPTHYEALLLKGKIYYDLGKNDDAFTWDSKSIEVYDRNGEAYFERGLMYYYQDKYLEASQDFIDAGNLKYKRADYFYFKGLTLHELGEDYQACKAWTKAKKLGIDQDVESLKIEYCQNVQKPKKK